MRGACPPFRDRSELQCMAEPNFLHWSTKLRMHWTGIDTWLNTLAPRHGEIHALRVKDAPEGPCEVCGKTFASTVALDTHERTKLRPDLLMPANCLVNRKGAQCACPDSKPEAG